MTLYVSTRDAPDASACFGPCSQVWTPLFSRLGRAVPGEGLRVPLGTLARPDGGRQVTYAGRPLYRFSQDASPGDANGQGFDGVWSVSPVLSPTTQPSPTVSAARAADGAPIPHRRARADAVSVRARSTRA